MIKPVASYYPPSVVEETNRGVRSYDLYSRMLEEFIVFLGTPIDDNVANNVCAQLLYLEYKNADKDISLYINSPGGDITALFAIYDTLKFVKNDISTFCYGQERQLPPCCWPAALTASGSPCRTPEFSSTSRMAGPPGRRPTSRSRPRRS